MKTPKKFSNDCLFDENNFIRPLGQKQLLSLTDDLRKTLARIDALVGDVTAVQHIRSAIESLERNFYVHDRVA